MQSIISLILFYSNLYGIDPQLAQAIVEQESAFKPNIVGSQGEIGLFQLHPKYFKLKKSKLLDVRTNIRLGIKHLSEVKKQCKHKIDNTWIICYNLGVAKASRIKHPKLFKYYKQVIKRYRRRQTNA